MSSVMTESGRKPPHETLDAQLVRYWEREAARFDELSARASFSWLGRLYARKAQRALEKAERSRAREIARGRLPATAQVAASDGDSSG
ncbi:hypothetical protein ABEV34_01905 [Methylorubrum rhodesianum]|jgi:NAD dependent epimerase/dehydratase family enzyme|uniref:Uncharacterized protein n=2 Tax=Methylobacteriaceae TaxID=119045 RepID=A0ABU9ZDZ5_9HYPH|nr:MULTISPECIES: hypothetical protein [Methylorubrum]MBI1688755.1 hypothetical protein [Methylorubrum sp. DB1722]MBK3404804.1 hypothetical protein [Methylorubrum rhodesianum]MBY0142819.1 hypothetical protein [Methylorubrum populi]MRI52816.1 hypothetical protein [Methylobacterium sp. DB1607]